MTSPSGARRRQVPGSARRLARQLLLAFGPALACACVHAPCPPAATVPATAGAPDPHLVGFSRAVCFAYYLEEKGWDAESARHIGGGYVELGTKPIEAYEALASFIRAFEPPLGSQQPTDAHLARCFQIEDDAEWQRLVRAH